MMQYQALSLLLTASAVSAFNVNPIVAPKIDIASLVAAPQLQPKFPYTWEPLAAAEVLDTIEAMPQQQDRPLMVALVGIPGSGKSTSCHNVADILGVAGHPCMIMPFDGYHIPVDDLKKLPNADDAIYRRGAPDTFDPKSLKRDLLSIRDGQQTTMEFPGFDHAVGDPTPNEHTFLRGAHKVVLCEGLYLLHDEDQWDLHECFDYTIFIESDVDLCMDRLKIRNKCIPGYTPDEIEFRVDAVDRVNANTVNRGMDRASLVVQSAVF